LRTDKRWSSQFCMQRCRKQYKTDKEVGKSSMILIPCDSEVSSQTAIQLRPMNHSAHSPVPKFTIHSVDKFDIHNPRFPTAGINSTEDLLVVHDCRTSTDKATAAVRNGIAGLVGGRSPRWRGIGTRRRTRRGTSGHRWGRGVRARGRAGGRRTRRCAPGRG
jgi:hypothetical protein